MREIEADALHQRHRGAALRVDRERARGIRRRRTRRLAGERRVEQIGQKARDLVEQAVDHRDRAAGLVLVEQRLVRARRRARSALTAATSRSSAEHSFEPGQHGMQSHLPGAPCATPLAFASRRATSPRRVRPGPRRHAASAAASRADWRAATGPSAAASPSASSSSSSISGAVRCWWAMQAQGRELLGARRRAAGAASSRRCPSAAPRSPARPRRCRRNRASSSVIGGHPRLSPWRRWYRT